MTHLVLLFIGLLHGSHSEAEHANAGFVFPPKKYRRVYGIKVLKAAPVRAVKGQ